MLIRKIKNRKLIFQKLSKMMFSSDTIDIPTICIKKYLNKSEGWEKECKAVADCLYETGVLVVKDPVIFLF